VRTSIFNSFADLKKEFHEDFDVLWRLTPESRSFLLPAMSRLAKCRTTGDKKAQIDRVVSEAGGNAGEVLSAVKILRYIYQEWNPIRDTSESFALDLADLGLMPEEKNHEAREFLEKFLSWIQSENDSRIGKMFASSLLPSYIGCETLVDFRSVIRNPYGSELDETIEDYSPTCIGFVPVVIVQMRRDAGDPEQFEFQCEEDALQRLVYSLQAALKDLKSARSSLPGGE